MSFYLMNLTVREKLGMTEVALRRSPYFLAALVDCSNVLREQHTIG